MCLTGGNKGQSTTTTAPPAAFTNAYTNLVNSGSQLAQQPLQQYSGSEVAGFTPQQQQAFSTIQNSQGMAQPYYDAAAQYAGMSATPESVPGGLSDQSIGGLLQSGTDYTTAAGNTDIAGAAAPGLNAASQNAANAYSALDPNLVNAGLGVTGSALQAAGTGYNAIQAAQGQGPAVNPMLLGQAGGYTQSAVNAAGSAPSGLNPALVGGATGAVQGAQTAAAGAANALNPALVQQGLGAVQGGANTGLGTAQAGLGASNALGQQATNIATGTQGPLGGALGAAGTDIYGNLTPFSASAVNQYQSPYTQDVVNATQAEFNNQNAQAQQQLAGNIMSQGAWGGDRAGIAQAELANQQQLAQAPVIAGLNNQAYTQALGQFNTQNNLQAQTQGQQAALAANTGLSAAQLGANTALGAGSQALQGGLGVGSQALQGGQAVGSQALQSAGLGANTNLTAAQLAAQTGLGAGSQYANLATSQANQGLNAAQLAANTGLGASGQALNAAQLQAQTGLAQRSLNANTILGASGQAANTALGAGNQIQQAAGLGAQYGLSAAQLGAQTGLSSAQLASQNANAQAAQQQQTAAQLTGLGTSQQQLGLGAQQANNQSAAQAAGLIANLGTASQNAALNGANANLQAGTLQQQEAQAQLNVPYQQFLQQQAYPYQQLNFLGGLTSGLGSLAGGTSTSTPAQPSPVSQIAGLGLAALPFLKKGGRVRRADGGKGGSVTGARGVSIPQYGRDMFAPPTDMAPGAGLGQWFNPLPQVQAKDVGGASPIVTPMNPAMAGLGTSAPGGGIPGQGSLGASSPQTRSLAMQMMMRPGMADGGDTDDDDDGRGPPDAFVDGDTGGVGVATDRVAQAGEYPTSWAPSGGLGAGAGTGAGFNYQPPKPDPKMALATAGLAMLAGGSPFPGVNIGRGALAGLQAYQSDLDKDAHPLVDHSGETIRVYYPSERKWIDTGIPTQESLRTKSDIEWRKSQGIHAQAQETIAQARQDALDKRSDAAEKAALARQDLADKHEAELERENRARDSVNAAREAKESFQPVPDPLTGKIRIFNKSAGKFVDEPPGGQSAGPDTTNLKGDDFLATVPKEQAAQVKALAEGRMQFPTGNAVRAPYWQNMLDMVAKYDPNFDAVNYNSRSKVRNDFTSGQSAKAIGAMNTALGHAARTSDNLKKLGNWGGFPFATTANAMGNTLAAGAGSSKVTNAQTDIDALSAEARKVFAATGGGSLTELEDWKKNFPINGSPDQQQGALKEFVGLLDSRLNTLGEQYNKGMGTTKEPMELLHPEARKAYIKLTDREPESATTGVPAAAAPGALPFVHPPNLPPGTMFSPSRQQYKTPDGTVLDKNGNPIK